MKTQMGTTVMCVLMVGLLSAGAGGMTASADSQRTTARTSAVSQVEAIGSIAGSVLMQGMLSMQESVSDRFAKAGYEMPHNGFVQDQSVVSFVTKVGYQVARAVQGAYVMVLEAGVTVARHVYLPLFDDDYRQAKIEKP